MGDERAGTAGLRAHVQIYNPGGSGLVVIVTDVSVGSDASNLITCISGAGAFTQLDARGLNAGDMSGLSVAEIRSDQLAAIAGNQYGLKRCPANATVDYFRDVAIRVAPGQYLGFCKAVGISLLTVHFEWIELPQ
jgi:hypothetical protein